MNPIITNILSTLVRNGLLLVGAWMAQHNIHWINSESQTDLVNGIVSFILVGGSLAWSVLRSHFMKQKIVNLGGDVVGAPTVKNPPVAAIISAIGLGMMLVSCAIVSPFDQNSFDATKKLKFQTLQLVSHGSEDPANYQDQIKQLQSDLDTEISYEKGKGPKNIATQKQWEILTSEHQLLGRFLKSWSGGHKFSQAFIEEESKIFSDTFDQIVELESAKQN